MSSYKIIISGGGTGGHIFPAIAIANALKQKLDDVDILFVGAVGRMEMEKVPAAGYQIIGLPIMGLQRRLTYKNLLFPFKLLISLWKAKSIIKDFKPQIAIGVGGYASGPLLKQAEKLGVPSLIQEQNSYAGITNKLLAKNAEKICVAYEGMEKFFPKEKIILTGNPVRQDINTLFEKRKEAISFYQFDVNQKTLLVIGGSLGARTINEGIIDMLPTIAKENIQLIWQTGKTFFPTAQEAIQKFDQNNIKAFAFIEKMDLAYAASDMVISRAGAISVSELCIAKKPAILIPSPNVAEDHQTKNALAITSKNAGVLIHQKELNEKFEDELNSLLSDENRCRALGKAIKELAMPDATVHIVDEVEKLLNTNEK